MVVLTEDLIEEGTVELVLVRGNTYIYMNDLAGV
jgi:hypothetical protein